jgi:hypothetical protein
VLVPLGWPRMAVIFKRAIAVKSEWKLGNAKLTNTVLLAVRVFSRWVGTADGINHGVSIISLLVLTKTAT